MKILPLVFSLLFIACAQPDFNLQFEKAADNLQFPEGPAWDGQEHVYVSNCYGGWITDIQKTGVDTFAVADSSKSCFRQSNGLAFNRDGFLYACDFGTGAIIRFDLSGQCEVVADGYRGQRFNRPNDLAFAPDGSLYFTDPKSYDRQNPDGKVYRYQLENDSVQLVADHLCFPNGIAISANGRWVYIAESAKERVLKFHLSKDGLLTERTVFANIPGGDPDGIALDKKGNVYVAHFGGGKIIVFDAHGNQIAAIPVPGKKPSNLEFAGKDLKTLYVTEDETNAVYRARVPIAGLPLFHQTKP